MDRINRLIEETERDRAHYASMRDKPGMGQHDRERYGIDAAACAIRLIALKQCRRIVNEEFGDV